MRFVSQIFVAALVVLWVFPATAENAKFEQQAHKLVEDLANDVTSFLGEEARTDAEIKKKFTKIFSQSFDLPRIGRFVLGTYWRTATPKQRKEYTALFKRYIISSYAHKFKGYDGEKILILEAKAKNRYAIVRTQLKSPAESSPVAIDWRVRKDKKGKLKIVDVIIEGVSMSLTQRSDFGAVIEKNGGKIEALLQSLRDKEVQVTSTDKQSS